MMKNNFRITHIILFIAGILILSSCSNKEVVTDCLHGTTFGFWGGLWQGIIAPIDLVVMFFRDDVTVYAQNNDGMWYATGFLIGSGGWGMLGSMFKRKS